MPLGCENPHLFSRFMRFASGFEELPFCAESRRTSPTLTRAADPSSGGPGEDTVAETLSLVKVCSFGPSNDSFP